MQAAQKPPGQPFPQDLFDRPDAPVFVFQEAFDSWLDHVRQGQVRRGSSATAYRHMWGAFSRWCLAQRPPVELDRVTPDDLQAFIASRHGAESPEMDLSPRYVWRMLHLIDRVLVHRAGEQDQAPNTAAAELQASRPEWQYANAAEADPLPDYFTAGEGKRLVTFLSSARPRAGGRGSLHTWQELRNHASVGLQLGAGLAPGDVRALKTASPVVEGGRLSGVPWKVIVPADGLSAERETPVAPWAGQLLRHWLEVRAQMGIPGEHLFPSTRTGKPWGKVAQYEACRQVLEAAGIDPVKGGSFRLRHTFALRQLRRGRSPEEVARWLGVVDPAVVARYQRVLTAPVDELV